MLEYLVNCCRSDIVSWIMLHCIDDDVLGSMMNKYQSLDNISNLYEAN